MLIIVHGTLAENNLASRAAQFILPRNRLDSAWLSTPCERGARTKAAGGSRPTAKNERNVDVTRALFRPKCARQIP